MASPHPPSEPRQEARNGLLTFLRHGPTTSRSPERGASYLNRIMTSSICRQRATAAHRDGHVGAGPGRGCRDRRLRSPRRRSRSAASSWSTAGTATTRLKWPPRSPPPGTVRSMRDRCWSRRPGLPLSSRWTPLLRPPRLRPRQPVRLARHLPPRCGCDRQSPASKKHPDRLGRVFSPWATSPFFAPLLALGPIVAKRSLGGARAWAAIVACLEGGSVLGGLSLLRVRPSRPLLVGVSLLSLLALLNALLAVPAPTVAIAAGALAGGFGLSVFNTLLETTVQQHV
jgi:hypothetical protein